MHFKIKKYMPTGIAAVGFVLSLVLIVSSVLLGKKEWSYELYIIRKCLFESGVLVFAECFAASIIFRLLLRKEKHEDRDSRRK